MDSLDSIWINRTLPANLSHFGYALLVFAIYRKVEDIASQSHSRLSIFTPVALSHGTTTGTLSPTRSSADALYGKWRNSACDSLDVLHWSINGQIAKSGGLEPPCTLILHLSRLLILSPVAELQSLAEGISAHTGTLYETQAYLHEARSAARTRAVRWVLQDRFKARLCLVHAGALYWYIRRYGTDSPLEPFAIYLATLVLWAYSAITQVCTQLRPSKTHKETCDSHGVDQDTLERQSSSFCSPVAERNAITDTPFIYLDRPCDDEMVQNFVREGQLMTAFITGAGDISAKDSADKILQVGARLLEGESPRHSISDSATSSRDSLPYVWAIQKQYADSLLRLSSSNG